MPNELGTMDPIESPEKMQNLDIIDLCNRLDTYLLESAQSASATRHETSDHDSKRMEAMIARFKSRFELYNGEPELDLPKYHPKALPVPTPPTINNVENADIQQFLKLLIALRIELAFSDSAERSTSFKSADKARVDAVIEKLEKFVKVVDGEDEIDLPDVDRQEPPAQQD